MFQLLWKWQYSGDDGESSALRRAASVALPPVIDVYAVVVVITNISVSIQLAVLLPVLGAVFTALLVLGGPTFNPSERDRDSAQWQGRGLPTVHGPVGRRPLRGPLP